MEYYRNECNLFVTDKKRSIVIIIVVYYHLRILALFIIQLLHIFIGRRESEITHIQIKGWLRRDKLCGKEELDIPYASYWEC